MPQDLVKTSRIDPLDIQGHIPENTPLTCWIRHSDGMIGLGETHARTFASAQEAEQWWTDLCEHTTIDHDCSLNEDPMASPVAFISFPFTRAGAYEVVVPEVVYGRRGDMYWMTTWNNAHIGLGSQQYEPSQVTFRAGSLDETHWKHAVREAVTRIEAGDIEKVVLARDETGQAERPIDLRHVISRLIATYPSTWTFCVKGLVGATPELLIRRDRGLVTSRVLAGTIHGDSDPAALAQALASSSKDLAEHEYAVASVADALRPHVTSLHVPEMPFTLRLPNVMHLASDITGAARPETTVLGLAQAIHPSAAVCGTPTDVARETIAELEHLDRGRYAGPVGWINAQGDGEIGIALRCGQFTDSEVRIFAGAGIVADSDPDAEWDETAAKLAPMKQTLSQTD
ncbi:MAG: chorismate-binding protein [Propionibacteriaceae bacterium]|nr:chorismate-binding protein [Propionibacteriaceae bacterium]